MPTRNVVRAMVVGFAATSLLTAGCASRSEEGGAPQAPMTTHASMPPSNSSPPPLASRRASASAATSAAAGPNKIGENDLRRAVEAAQGRSSDARLLAAEPETAEGRKVWRVAVLTNEPAVAAYDVDPRTFNARQRNQPPADQPWTRLREIASVDWTDAVAIATEQTQGTLARVRLDNVADQPDRPMWKVTVLSEDQKVEYEIDAQNGNVLHREIDRREGDDWS
ncbi:Peptidase propeptide and YPEB domain-containing protein [Streptoalloteichus tenebrarius]|uniref:Peptidase propeptide and YPEB domain-containing protein n=1 Tax=Streptoalloteichus tenebrarius (strain ATCC 17920 / DSM 40477 / JCM 4838 / CBS 697.72 / NBRC 16177 / NCIMB 11028 / NRRL B-12390 / A12253. 1 / ISP 5477) TaxID=1933 RepID=A0ABT1HW53_STRSD|nr:PepSY domain-containing protein [Streptoalloteichus tenebrarius]MCP2259754.1 Peptidase propeptide and YPEB domain-containing protein [Streptoalloteichus tenebrarius]BFF00737.1 hypothetical protein GCM10020241_24120 [Streptoalloteichus tenebrarius]